MKMYITKYALTKGIQIGEGTPRGDTSARVASPKWGSLYYFGDEWHTTAKAAKLQAETMRDRKIVALRKQLAKLENMTFEVPK